MLTRIVACEVMREELLRVRAAGPVQFSFLSMGLHVAPLRLREALAAALAERTDAARIILGFGLCGYAVDGLVSPHAPLFIPRVHDCIAVLTDGCGLAGGGCPEKGTFYLSGGWLEGERALGAEHRRLVARFGEKKGTHLLKRMLAAYRRLAFVRTDHPRREACEAGARELSMLLGLPLEVVQGGGAMLERIVNGPWEGRDFVQARPGEPVDGAAFLDLPVRSPIPAARRGVPCGDDPQAGTPRGR